jgi:hypothetical protein
MAKIVAGVGTSHTPAIGAAIDNGKTGDPYWAPLFKGYEPAKQWMVETKPDVVIMVYNDHVNAFDFKIIPTFSETGLYHQGLIGAVPGRRNRVSRIPDITAFASTEVDFAGIRCGKAQRLLHYVACLFFCI